MITPEGNHFWKPHAFRIKVINEYIEGKVPTGDSAIPNAVREPARQTLRADKIRARTTPS